MWQKRLKYAFGGLGLKTTRPAYRGFDRATLTNYHNLPVWIYLSVSEDKPYMLGYFGVSSL